jgi:hypothetical protein
LAIFQGVVYFIENYLKNLLHGTNSIVKIKKINSTIFNEKKNIKKLIENQELKFLDTKT